MSEMLKRKDSETDFEYKLRLSMAKLNKEIDLDWHELVELLKLDCSSDHLRKLSYGYKECLEYIEENKKNNSSDDLLQELDLKIIELDKTRKKLQATKSEYNRALRVDSRFELLYENISNSIQRLAPPTLLERHMVVGNKEYILGISDIHYGSTFETSNNKYSREVCKERFEKLLAETISFVKENKVSKLKVLNNSDSLQGMLRISDVKMNDIPVVEALVEFCQLMASFLNRLSQHCEIEYLHVPSANHTQLRLLNTKAGEMATEDMEKIIVNYIGDMLLDNKNITVIREMKMDNLQFEICGRNIIALHGHQIKNMNSSVRDLSQTYRKFFDVVILGHFHGGKELTVGSDIEVLVTPSFVGGCPYAQSLNLHSRPMAKIYKFEDFRGYIGSERIYLD